MRILSAGGRRSMVVASLVLLSLAASGLVKSGFRTIPIGLIFLGTLGFVMALLPPDERGRTVSTAEAPGGSDEDSTLLQRPWPIIGGHLRLRVWMCFGTLTLSSLSFQVAFAKLAFSAETAKGARSSRIRIRLRQCRSHPLADA